MKKTNIRFFLLLMAVLFALSSTACVKKNDPAHIDPAEQSAAPSPEREDHRRKNSMMNSDNSKATAIADLLFFIDSGDLPRLCYLDLVTGENMFLCAKPDCTHNGADCNAYVANAGNLTSDGSRLFWTERSLSSRSWKLYSMSTDGTDRRAEAELDYSKAEYAGDAGTAGIFNNKLFMCLCRSGISGGEVSYSTLIFSHDLSSGAEKTLFEETSGRKCLGRIFGDKLYFVLFDSDVVSFNCCDLITGEISELHNTEMPAYASEPLQMYCSGGILLLMGSFDCWAYDIANDRFFALRQWTEDPSGETAIAFCTTDRILLYCGMNNYRFEDMQGNVLSEGKIEAPGFNKTAFTKEPIGCVDGKILLRFESMDDDETPYLLSFSIDTCEWKTEWSGTAD